MERATAHLELAIDVNSDPITGSVSKATNGSQPFSGWVELVAAIEAARSATAPVAPSGEHEMQTLGSRPGANAPGL